MEIKETLILIFLLTIDEWAQRIQNLSKESEI